MSNFGSSVPFAEPAWYAGFSSPYYNENHRQFRARLRAFVDKHKHEIFDVDEKANRGETVSLEIFRKAVAAGLYAPMIPLEWGGTPPVGGWDAFSDLIWLDELRRFNCGGFQIGFSIFTMAFPPILLWGSDYLKQKVLRDIATARKFISLAISEPTAGSDVANITTSAVRQGDFYIVNGSKKWITWAKYADFFTTAVRTGGSGHGGISLLLIERTMPGVTIRPIPLQSQWAAGTSYVTFEDVKVPVRNLIGEENQGFKMIMHNFNHERFSLAVGCVRASRLCIEESISYARERRVFGKRLLDSQVIRHKIGDMAMRVESLWSQIENVTFQMQKGVSMDVLGGPIALLKVQGSRTQELCAREASQIFGGSSLVREGKGAAVERLYRDVRSQAIPGGSEEILIDLAMRRAKL